MTVKGTTHELKTVKPYFEAIKRGFKTFEVRYNDRFFREGDSLILRHWCEEDKEYFDEWIECRVEYILRDFEGLKPNYVVMAIGGIRHCKGDYDEIDD